MTSWKTVFGWTACALCLSGSATWAQDGSARISKPAFRPASYSEPSYVADVEHGIGEAAGEFSDVWSDGWGGYGGGRSRSPLTYRFQNTSHALQSRVDAWTNPAYGPQGGCYGGDCYGGYGGPAYGGDCYGGHCHGHGRSGFGAYMKSKFGYFVPTGNGGSGSPFIGGYHRVYPENPAYSDHRDNQVWAAQGYGVPVAVPLAPVVGHQYNYSWGMPASRLTPISHPAN